MLWRTSADSSGDRPLQHWLELTTLVGEIRYRITNRLVVGTLCKPSVGGRCLAIFNILWHIHQVDSAASSPTSKAWCHVRCIAATGKCMAVSGQDTM
jgi:hypothetical protein